MSSNIMDALPVYPDAPPPQAPPRPFPLHPNFWWAILWCIGLLLFTQVPGAVVAGVIMLAGMLLFPRQFPADQMKPEDLLSNPIALVAMGVGVIVAHVLIIVLALVCLRVIAGRDWPRQVALRAPSLRHLLLVVLLVPGFMVLANASAYFFQEVLRFPSLFKALGLTGTEDLETAFKGPVAVLAALIIGVMPGLSEELWCRAYLGRGIVGRHGYVLGVLGTSFLFGAIHVDPIQGSMAMVVGIVLHYVYLTSRSLLIPMLLHFFNNSLAVLLGQVPTWQKIVPSSGLAPAPILAAGLLLLIAVCYAYYQSRARLVTPEGAAPWQPPYPGVVCPPPNSATFVHTPPLSAVSVLVLLLALAGWGAAVYIAVFLR